MLHQEIDQLFDCTWLPGGTLSLVLGAHTGPVWWSCLRAASRFCWYAICLDLKLFWT